MARLRNSLRCNDFGSYWGSSGSARLVGTTVSVDPERPNGSVFEVVRVRFDDWTIEFKELAEWFALEISRMIVDHGLIH